MNLGCWVAPRSYALAQAGQAFDPQGHLTSETHRNAVVRVVTQTFWAAERLQPQA